MPTEFSGKHLLELVTKVQERSTEIISETRNVLSPMLATQGKSLESEETFASLIKDINKLTTVEKHINNGSLKDMRYVESGLFTNSIIPSNVVTIGENRSIYVEEGLLYILDFDVTTLTVTKKEVHKIPPLWDLCRDNNTVKLVLGEEILWAVPTHGAYILGLRGNGIFSSGPINYMKLPLEQDLVISDFKECNRDIAFISNENRYYRIDQVYDTTGWTADNWRSCSMNRCFATCICDGNLDYVGTQYGEIWKFHKETEDFDYVTDTKNVTDYEDHYRDLIANRDNYKPILYMAKNDVQWSIIENPNILYFSMSMDGENLDSILEPVELPGNLSVASIAVNRRSYYDRSIIYGYDDELNVVAYSYRTSFDEIKTIELGFNDLLPQWISVSISDNGAVIIELYEHTISASQYYSEESITKNGYNDFKYTSLAMRQATYEDYEFVFGPEFNPLFIPAFIKSEKGKTVVVDKGSTSLSFNIAFTSDQSHWNLVNLPADKSINVQDMDSGNGIFVLVGLKNDSVLISKNAYKWDKIALSETNLELTSVVYNRHRNKFYAVNCEGTKLVEINPVNMSSTIKDLSGITSATYYTYVKNVCSFAHNLIIVAESNGMTISYRTTAGELDEDILINGITKFTMKLFDNVDQYSSVSSSIVNTFEVADKIYSVHSLNLPWDPDGETDYDKSLLTGVIVVHPNYDRELSSQIIGAGEYRYAVFPYDKKCMVYCMEYLNHIVVIQQQEKYFIPMNKTSAPICYHYNENGMFFMVQVNAKCGCIGDGFLHLIQSHTSSFTRIAYIMSSDQSYSPVVTNVDLVADKKNVRVSQYELENDHDNIDRNGNIEVYPVLYSDLKDVYPGSIIRTDKFIRVGKGSVGYVSDDGVHWTVGFNLPSDGWWRDIAYGVNTNGEPTYVALKFINATTSEIWHSSNLVTWNKSSVPELSYGWSEIAYSNGCFAAVAHYTTNSKHILHSLDGKTWTSIILEHAVDKIYPNMFNGDGFVTFSSIISSGRETYFYVGRNGSVIKPLTFKNDAGNVNNVVDAAVNVTYQMLNDNETCYSFIYNMIDNKGIVYLAKSLEDQSVPNKVYAASSIPDKPTSSQMFIAAETGLTVYYDAKLKNLYIDYYDNEMNGSSPVKVALPDEFPVRIGHAICYYDDKLYVGLSNPVIIDLHNTFPDRIDGSFMIENSARHYRTLPFTPDHVFFFGADSDSTHDKILIGEIHREDMVGTSNGTSQSSVVFNNTEESTRYRSDINDVIVERGFVYTNHTNTDRLINFIAIKENRYS